jgi:hypothetical protein
MTRWCVSCGKYASIGRRFTVMRPTPGISQTLAMADFRLPVL